MPEDRQKFEEGLKSLEVGKIYKFIFLADGSRMKCVLTDIHDDYLEGEYLDDEGNPTLIRFSAIGAVYKIRE